MLMQASDSALVIWTLSYANLQLSRKRAGAQKRQRSLRPTRPEPALTQDALLPYKQSMEKLDRPRTRGTS